MEDRLRSLGILSKVDGHTLNSTLNSATFKTIDLQNNMQTKKMNADIRSLVPSDSFELLGVLVAMWQTRSSGGKYVLPWVYSILVNHSSHIMSEEPKIQILSSLLKATKSIGAAIHPLLQLSGRVQLLMAQIDKATHTKSHILSQEQQREENEDEDEDVNEIHYGEEDSEIRSDDDQ